MSRLAPAVAGALAAGTLLAGCAATPPPVPVTAADAASVTYSGVLEKPVTLVQGLYEGEPYVPDGVARPRLVLVRDLVVTGDLNGDGADDAAAILSASGGGSGEFVYLSIITGATGQPESAGAVLLGDRVDIRSMDVEDGLVKLRVVTAGPDDPACCPSLERRVVFALKNAAVVETASADLGRLSPGSLAGTRWRLSHFDRGETAPAEPPVTLAFGENGDFAGGSGCNRYMGRMSAGEDNPLQVGPIASTSRMCPEEIMAVEDRYLKLLAGTRQLGFFNARLALTYQSGDATGLLLFETMDEPGE